VDTDYYIGFEPLSQSRHDERSKRAIIRLYGVTETGQSVLCHCVGFAPYFYCNAPPGFVKGRDEDSIRNALNSAMLSNDYSKQKCDVYVTKIVAVQRQSIWHYHFGKSELVLKVYTALPTLVPSARKIIQQEGFRLRPGDTKLFTSTTYESNLTFALRYMIDRNIVGAGWIAVDAGRYHVVPKSSMSSHCSLEIVARCDSVHGIEDDKIAPLRVLSFDIECMCSDGFPEPGREADAVIQISNVCYIQGSDEVEHDKEKNDVEMKETEQADEKEKEESESPNPDKDVYFHQSVFCLKSCSPIPGCKIYAYDTERQLLTEWAKFVRKMDADILTGYNIVNFDLPYLLNRAAYLKIPEFAYLGRQKTDKSQVKESSFSSKAYGTTKSKDINISGRIQMDLLPIIRRDHKLRSYSLNSVSFHFLGSQKEDVDYSIIGDLQNGNEETRRRLAAYCLKDSILPMQLIAKLQTTINLIEMARVTGVPINFLITRGQQIKVLSQLYRVTKKKELIIPYLQYDREAAQQAQSDGGVAYEGATVIEPVRGFYKEPITTLDFASLYPSIMIAHNLCYSTLISKAEIERHGLDEAQYTETPNKHDFFVKSSVQKGVLPEILENLLSQRKKVKKQMKELAKAGKQETMQYAVYNGRQLALKISANSVYGFTGATVGSLPCLTISAAVTAFGRDMIHDTKKFVEDHYSVSNGHPFNAQVIYGDTDSVMIKFGDDISMSDAMRFGREAASLVTRSLFIAPIQLEFEKVYRPYLLMNKKRYAGMLWSSEQQWDYMDAKGIETVRRDNCPLTKNLVQSVLNYILIAGDVQKAVDYAKGVIAKLLQNKIDLSSLIVTKKLNKMEDYKVKSAHVELVKRMRRRRGDYSKSYKTGDRVSYVIIRGGKKAKAYEKAEDPLYALENGIAIDTEYYLHNQLEQPLTRIFEPILGEQGVRDLFHGKHTRIIKVSTSSVGAMMNFVVKKTTCIGCKCILRGSNGSNSKLCSKCKSKESQLYLKQMGVARKHQRHFHKLWTHCQRCQGSTTQQVLCSNRDCPIFYKRTKVKKDLQEALAALKHFSL